MLYGHGDDAYLQKNEIIANFSTNVYIGKEPKGLKEHLFSQWHKINTYPEILAESLREKIAQHHQLQETNVLVLNGAEEGIHLIAQVFQRKKTAIFTPTFSEYEDACKIHQHQLDFFPFGNTQNLINIDLDADLVFICNPNNPTGEILTIDRIEHLLEKYPQTFFCIDEAFMNFTLSISSCVSLLQSHQNLIILKSLTKNFAIPGLRLGYLLASEILIKKMQDVKITWSVNALAIEAGKYIFENYDIHSKENIPLKELLIQKDNFFKQLKQIPNFEWYPSHTHFFLGKTLKKTASKLKQYLVNEHQILIRDASNFRGLDQTFFRIATLSRNENKLLQQALEDWNEYK